MQYTGSPEIIDRFYDDLDGDGGVDAILWFQETENNGNVREYSATGAQHCAAFFLHADTIFSVRNPATLIKVNGCRYLMGRTRGRDAWGAQVLVSLGRTSDSCPIRYGLGRMEAH